MKTATAIRRTARRAGLLYLAMSVLAMVGFFQLRPLFYVARDPAATARSILAHESLYRISIVCDVVTQLLFVLVVLALYELYEDVDRGLARTMVAIVGTGIVAGFAGFALNFAPLVLLQSPTAAAVFGREQLEALSFLALQLGNRQGDLLTAIWGLWLFPFAVLTMRCGFLPRFLGVLLGLTGVAYVATSVTAVALPAQVALVRTYAFPLYFGEFVVVLWLALIGARPRALAA